MKLVIVSIDGLGGEVLPYFPRLNQLKKRGGSGIFYTSPPTLTPSTWASIFTGKTPGEHGVFGLYKIQQNWDKTEVKATDIEGETIWEYFYRKKIKVVAISLPMTYPSFMVDGIMVSDVTRHEEVEQKSVTYPSDLYFNLIPQFTPLFTLKPMSYFPEGGFKQEEEVYFFIERLKKILTLKEKLTLLLVEEVDWDLLWVHFFTPDIIQHPLWSYIEEKKENKICSWVISFWEKLDSCISKILYIHPSVGRFVFSTHNFRRAKWVLNLKKWLKERRFNSVKLWKRYFRGMGGIKEDKVIPDKKLLYVKKNKPKIYNQLIHELYNLTHPTSSFPVIKKIYNPSSLYPLKCSPPIPDCILEFNHFFTSMDGGYFGNTFLPQEPGRDFFVGTHSPYGVYVVEGLKYFKGGKNISPQEVRGIILKELEK